MAAHRVYHWKHGWIPLDGYALQATQHRAAIVETAKRRESSDVGGYRVDVTEEKVEGAPHVSILAEKNAEKGFWHSAAIQRLDAPVSTFTADQKREVAAATEDIFKRFPGLHNGRDQTVEAVSENDSYWGATEAQGRKHIVGLSKALWDNPDQVRNQMADWHASHGALAGNVSTPKEFRRQTLIHEMGHVVHLRARDKFGTRNNAIDDLVFEPVTPRQMGFTDVGRNVPQSFLDQPVPRWMADNLDKRSAYASSSEYEFYAEAFLDGMVNGDKASVTGKRAVAAATQLFGKAAS